MTYVSKKIIQILCIIILTLVLGLVIFEKYRLENSLVLQETKAVEVPVEKVDYYKDLNLEAKSALVYDLTDQRILYEKYPYIARPLASLTKIATALVGRTLLPKNAEIIISDQSRTTFVDSNLKSNEKWSMRDLAQYFLVNSSNDGAQQLCDYVNQVIKEKNPTEGDCVALMNHYAQNQGLESMRFVNPTGLDNHDTSASNYGSAYDVARLMALAYTSYPGLFSVTAEPEVKFKTENFSYTATNTDKILDQIPGLLIGKTGYTDTAGGNLAIIYTPKQDKKIAIVILGSSQDGRFSDMLALVNHTKMYLDSN